MGVAVVMMMIMVMVMVVVVVVVYGIAIQQPHAGPFFHLGCVPQASRNCKVPDIESIYGGLNVGDGGNVGDGKLGKSQQLSLTFICCVPGYEKLLFVLFSSRLSRLIDDGVDDVCDDGDVGFYVDDVGDDGDVGVYVDDVDGDDGGGKNENTSTTQ